MKQREKFASRLGFILISAGCAIGLGNVYRFPIITGAYGGAIFVLIYLGFLVLLGWPVMTCEFAVGRAGQRSICTAFDELERPKQHWHLWKYGGIAGNYILMMSYTVITGIMMNYFVKYCIGSVTEAETATEMADVFYGICGNNTELIIGTYATIVIGLFICSLGLQKGVEKITKVMMVSLLVLMLGLAVYCCTLPGALTGLKFYLVPSVSNIREAGLINVINAAMGQAFFTLSLGIGAAGVFGSYIGKERRLGGESLIIIGLDTFVALMSGLIIFPAYYSYHTEAIEGEGGAFFLFTTITSIFNNMKGGRVVGIFFFLFMSFAALSTVIAVFENIVSFWLEKTNLSRCTIALINIGLLFVLSLPAVFAMNIWGDVKIFGMAIDKLEDVIISNYLLPIGSLIYVLFCTSRFGWGWNNYQAEVNCGEKGISFGKHKAVRIYMTFVLPIIILAVWIMPYLLN